MFERPHHPRIAKVLNALNSDLLQDCDCYLGGVPIVLALGECWRSLKTDHLVNFQRAPTDPSIEWLQFRFKGLACSLVEQNRR